MNIVSEKIYDDGTRQFEIEVECGINGTSVIFPKGEKWVFSKGFSVFPVGFSKPDVAAHVQPYSTLGFSLKCYRSVPKQLLPDGSIRYFDRKQPLEARVLLKITSN